MAARKRTHEENLELRAQIMKLRVRGYNQTQIAAQLGVNQQMVSYHMEEVEKEWQISAQQDLALHQAQALAQIQAVQQAAWEGYDRSLEPPTTSRTKHHALTDTGKPRGRSKDASTTGTSTKVNKQIAREREVEAPHNNGRDKSAVTLKYLALILQCVDQSSRLMGLSSIGSSSGAGEQENEIWPENEEEMNTVMEEILGFPMQKESTSHYASTSDTSTLNELNAPQTCALHRESADETSQIGGTKETSNGNAID